MPVAPDLVAFVNALPTPYLVLSPALVIEAVSDAYLLATLSARERLVGQYLFDAFPDNPLAPEANAVHNLHASLQQVLVTGRPHQMAQQHYDVPDPAHPGQFVERHWEFLTTPILDADGKVVRIIHSAQDVTTEGHSQAYLQASQSAEQAARTEAEQQRQRFYDLLMQLPAQVAVHEGPDQVFTLVNPGYQRLAPGRDLLGQPIREAWPELASQGILDVLDHVYRTGEPFIGKELPFQVDFTRTGQVEQVYFNAFFLPLRDAQGRVSGVLDFSYDITEQVLARQHIEQLNQVAQTALAEAEQQQARLYRVFEQAPAMICILQGPEHVFEFANPLYRALVGERPLIGRRFAEALPELAGQGILEPLDEVYRTGVPFYAGEQPARLDHDNTNPAELEQRYYNLVWQARRDLTGAVDGVLVFAYDVTPQVLARQQVEQFNHELETRVQQRTQETAQALAEAQRQRQRLNELVQQAPAAMCVVGGPEFRYEMFNPLYAAMFGGRPQVGRAMGEVLPEVVTHPSFRDFKAVYEQGRTIQQNEILVPLARPSDGALEDRYFSYTQQPRYDNQGQVDGVFVFAVEVTDQVRARQQVQALNNTLAATNQNLNTSNTQLTRTNVDLDTFVYTASHDLKAPITNIEGILAALRDTLPPPIQEEAVVAHLLGLLDNTVGRFLTTIDQLTDLARLQRAYDAPAERLALAPVVAGVLEDLAPLIDAAAAQVHLDVPAGLHVSFAPVSLRSTVYNLLSNAVKYRDPARPAQVWLRAEVQPGAVVLSVRDNGLGLTESQQGRLFGVFQRLHTHVEGTGVGLYMIKRLLENAGARISVTSAAGVGSTFTVTFPS